MNIQPINQLFIRGLVALLLGSVAYSSSTDLIVLVICTTVIL